MVLQLGEGSAIPIDPHHTPTIIQPSSSQTQKIQKPRKPTRKETQVPKPSGSTESVADKALNKELSDRLVRASTTASSLEAEQDSGNITKSQSKETSNEPCSQGTNSGVGLRCQKTIRDTIAQTRVESSGDEESLGEDASKQERRINVIDADEDITLINDVDNEMFNVDVLGGEEVFVAGQNENVVKEVVDTAQVSTAAITVIITTKEITLAQALEALKISKLKGKGIMIEEPVKPKKKDQVRLDEEAAKKLQAGFDKEERLAREKAKNEERANISLIKEWDDIQAKIDRAGEDLVQEITKKQKVEEDKETPKLKQFMETIPDEEEVAIDAIPLVVKSLRIVDWKIHKDGKKSYYQIGRYGRLVQVGEELIQKITKKQKVEDDKEKDELKQLMETSLDKEEVAIDAIPLAVKSPRIVDWKIRKERKKSYYQIVRVDGKSQMYMIFSQMLKIFDREDLEDLYKLVKFRYGSTRPVESMAYLLWSDMKIMFEPRMEDEVWKL
nr:hypothetical protein [Tanacetum cinerariifolium]